MMFQALTKANQLRTGNPESNIAICCLWMPRDRVANELDPQDYATIGNLYSTPRGIPYLLQNLLANPQIRNLVVLGVGVEKIDRSRSGKALLSLWSGNFVETVTTNGQRVWQIGDATDHDWCFSGPEHFTREMLNHLHNNVTIWLANSPDDIRRMMLNKQFGTHPDKTLAPWGEPIRIQLPEAVTEDVLPAQNSGFVVRGKTIADLWPQILYTVMRFGKLNDSHYDDVHMEALNLMAVLDSEADVVDVDFGDRTYGWLPGRFMSPSGEMIPDWIQATNSDLRTTETFREYCEKVLFGEGSAADEERGVVKYTYGDRMRWWFDDNDQIADVVQKLAREPIAKSAVISLWDPDHDHKHGGSPCLNHLWFRIVDSRLSMTVVIRSNDMYGAWPANAYSLRVLQSLIMTGVNTRLHTLGEPQVRLGPMTIVSESAHVYGDSFNAADDVIRDHYTPVVRRQMTQFNDPKGSFVIEVDHEDRLKGSQIVVNHIEPGDGRLLGQYRSTTALSMVRQLAEANVIEQISHALYIGTELSKAEFVVAHYPNYDYVQDQTPRRRVLF